MTDLTRYADEQCDTKPEDTTSIHELTAALACELADAATIRADFEQARAWLEVADANLRKPNEPFQPAIESRTPAMGGLLPAPRLVFSSGHAGQGPRRLSSQSEALRSVQRSDRARTHEPTHNRSAAPLQDDVAGMIAPDFRSPHLLSESFVLLVSLAISIAALALEKR